MSAAQSSLSRAQPAAGPHPILLRIAELRAWLFLVLLLVFFECWARIAYGSTFVFSVPTLQSISIYAVAPLLLALGSTFVIISAASTCRSASSWDCRRWWQRHTADLMGASMPPFPAMLVGIVAGVAVATIPGYINGLLISKLRVPPFIGTLGMYGVARGIAYLLAGGTTVPVSNAWFAALGNGRFYGVPVVVIVAALFLIAMHYLLSQTRFGQHTYAIGASEQAALRAGINVSQAHPQALCPVGRLRRHRRRALCRPFHRRRGASRRAAPARLDRRRGDRRRQPVRQLGSISGTLAGALVIAVIQFGLVYINVEPFWQFVSVGVVIVSVLVDQAQRSIAGGRRS